MSMTCAAVIRDADDPCSVNTAYAPESSFTMSPRNTTRPLYFWCFVSNSAFFKWHKSINDAKWTFLHSFPCFINHLFLVSDCRQLQYRNFLQFFPLVYHCCLCIRNSHCLRHRNEFVNKIVTIQRIDPFCSDMILMMFVYCSFWPWSHAFVGINNTSEFCLAISNTAVGFSTALYRYFARHCCWHRNFQLSTSGFDCELEFFIVWFNKNIPLNCLALSSLGFSIAHFCFSLRFNASDICVHISGHALSRREVVCFLASLPADHVYPPGGLSFNKMNLVQPFHAPDNLILFLHPRSSNLQYFLQHYVQCRMSRSGNVDVLHRNRKCCFLRHVQFDSWYNVMTINELSCDRPEVNFRFLIIPRRVFLKMGWSIPFVWISLTNFLFFASFRTFPG